MRQVTLVALYGEKAPHVADWLEKCQTEVKSILGAIFQPYDVRQLHATLVGLERSGSSNANFLLHRGKAVTMDLTGLLHFLRLGGRFPFQIQLGGFRDREYPFTSRGQNPYHRSFSLQKDKVVVMGWPLRGTPLNPAPPRRTMTDWIQGVMLRLLSPAIQESRTYPPVLDDLRQSFQGFNILHSWHRALTDVDNDFYLRLGTIEPAPLDPAAQKKVEAKLRDHLSRTPLVIEVGLAQVSFVAYEDESLPWESSESWPVGDGQVTGEFISTLYD